MAMDVQKFPGIGPVSQPTSCPIDEDCPLDGPSFWQTGGSHNDNDRQSRFQTDGQYWAQQPAEQSPGPAQGLEPTSDTTGSNPLPGDPGREGGNLNAEGMPVMGAAPAVDNC